MGGEISRTRSDESGCEFVEIGLQCLSLPKGVGCNKWNQVYVLRLHERNSRRIWHLSERAPCHGSVYDPCGSGMTLSDLAVSPYLGYGLYVCNFCNKRDYI